MNWFKSPAKINRFLRIKAKLPNGYHELVTIFEKVAFFDEIGIEIVEDGKSSIDIECPDWLPSGPDNLAYKAVDAFRRQGGLDFSVRLRLKKNIPAGAGLGGGSSNCGTVLMALNKLLREPFSQKRLISMASRLGADCPFFATEWTGAIGTGTGAELEPMELEPNWYILVLPDFSISTRWAYQNFKLTRKGDETIFEPRKVQSDYDWTNDLERPVITKYPAISRIKSSLIRAGARTALMSGSGSTVFGVFNTRQHATHALSRVKKETGYSCLVTRSLGKEETD